MGCLAGEDSVADWNAHSKGERPTLRCQRTTWREGSARAIHYNLPASPRPQNYRQPAGTPLPL